MPLVGFLFTRQKVTFNLLVRRITQMFKSCCCSCLSRNLCARRQFAEGFTLIELLVVLAIIAILATIALPNYTDYIIRSHIQDATSNLSAMRTQMELYYDNAHTYADISTSDQNPACATPPTSQFFIFGCDDQTDSAYTLTAIGQNAMNGFTLTLDEANNKATPAAGSGWTSNDSCWIQRRGGSC
jgi:type IV pilus assembly protein PilE